MILIKTLFCCFIFVSCDEQNGSSFYTRHYEDDLSRIPLIKPYELQNQRYADSNYDGTHGWSLKFRYRQFDGYIIQLNISNVNVSNGIIYGHGQDGKTNAPNYWFIIVPQKKSEQIFKNEKDWEDSLKSKDVNNVKVFSVWNIWGQFENSSILPWYNPGKNVYP